MKIRDILVFFIFLTAKIDGVVQIKSNWKFRRLNWEFFKFRRGTSKQVKVWGFSVKFPLIPFIEMILFSG